MPLQARSTPTLEKESAEKQSCQAERYMEFWNSSICYSSGMASTSKSHTECFEYSSSVNKFFDSEGLKKIADKFNATSGDLILIVANKPKVVFDSLGFLRRHIAGELGLLDDNKFNFLGLQLLILFSV